MTIALDTTLRRNGDILHAPVGTEEAVMLSVAAGKYYGLNAVALRVWELLEEPKTICQLRDAICTEFEVGAAACESDLLKFARELSDNGMIHVAGT